jgi:small-conductance mechanosensitive channel
MNTSHIPPEFFWVASTWSWIWPLLITGIYVSLAVLLHRWLAPRLRAWVGRSRTIWDDILLNILGWPMLLIFILGGVALLFSLWPMRTNTQTFILKVTRISTILLVVGFAHQFLNSWFRASRPGSWLRITLLRKLILFTLYTVAVMMVLADSGFDIKAPLATLGIGSVAVALATQQVLSNFFAGVQLSIDRPLEIGQSVMLENGMEGEVITIGWMKTWLRASDGSRLLIPNSKLTGFIIRNYTLGHRGPAVLIKLPIDRTADLELAEKLAREASHKITDPSTTKLLMEPIIQYTEMTATSAVMTVTLYAPDYKSAATTRSEFVKAISTAYAEAGIKLA